MASACPVRARGVPKRAAPKQVGWTQELLYGTNADGDRATRRPLVTQPESACTMGRTTPAQTQQMSQHLWPHAGLFYPDQEQCCSPLCVWISGPNPPGHPPGHINAVSFMENNDAPPLSRHQAAIGSRPMRARLAAGGNRWPGAGRLWLRNPRPRNRLIPAQSRRHRPASAAASAVPMFLRRLLLWPRHRYPDSFGLGAGSIGPEPSRDRDTLPPARSRMATRGIGKASYYWNPAHRPEPSSSPPAKTNAVSCQYRARDAVRRAPRVCQISLGNTTEDKTKTADCPLSKPNRLVRGSILRKKHRLHGAHRWRHRRASGNGQRQSLHNPASTGPGSTDVDEPALENGTHPRRRPQKAASYYTTRSMPGRAIGADH